MSHTQLYRKILDRIYYCEAIGDYQKVKRAAIAARIAGSAARILKLSRRGSDVWGCFVAFKTYQ